jgi:dual specificity protein kinase YAK1
MANRTAFIDFAQGLLNLNPLERWTPQQAKAHPFITQQKFTGPFTPLRQHSSRSPAPGVQEQQRAEAVSRQREREAQLQAQNAAYAQMQMNQYNQGQHPQAQGMYGNMYTPHQGGPPPYPTQAGYGQQQMGMMQGQPPRYNAQPNLYAQATTRAGRQRASTMDQNQSGIPPSLQRVISHLDPNAPIRLQPSPAYYPPPPDGAPDPQGNSRRRGSRAGGHRGNRDFIRTLEDRTLEEGFMNSSQHWQ